MNFDSFYSNELKEVLVEENPIFIWEDLLKDKPNITPTDILKLVVLLGRNWQKYQKYGINLSVVLNEEKKIDSGNHISQYDFVDDLRHILSSADKKGAIYEICANGFIISKRFTNRKISFDITCKHSHLNKNISFVLGLNGLDIIVNGVPCNTNNHLDSYQDLIKWSRLVGIESYKELLKEFFEQHVQYDKHRRFFLYKDTSPKEWHEIIDKNPKLLVIKPEKVFQMELERFLRDKCIDTVLNEVRNDYDERYDIWVGTNQNEVYVFELKWLGKSITQSGNINTKYNTPERAIEGAYQLKDYLENPSQALHGLPQLRIHQAVLVIYDARDEMSDIVYPTELTKIPNLDLTQHFKIEKEKVPASKVYKSQKE
ncbi:hypothetical protein [Anoxybacteroides rupiense]|uniref:hypothetical protein n=1 Tax=Anoxybacteroides rupiense TaxID=311460 RepID=UPI003FA529B6